MHLLACQKCSRQYDVSHLEIDATVHCQCDALLVVPPPRKLVCTALLCANCSGPVRPEDPACPYCRAEVSEIDRRESTLCPECYARISAKARHCGGCGVRIRPTALRPLPEDQACPRCEGGLQHRALGDSNVVECADCGGLWVAASLFDELCNKAVHDQLFPGDTATQSSASPSASPGAGSAHDDGIAPGRVARVSDELRYLSCVDCGELMVRRQFQHAGLSSRVIIDVCRNHGVWLDDTELERVAAFLRTSRAQQGYALGARRAPDAQRPDTVAERALIESLALEREKKGVLHITAEALVETLAIIGRLLSSGY